LFEERLADFFKIEADQVTLVCNGTLALQATLMAMDIPQGKYCLMPSWTFSATPASALLAGLTPLFLDVDVETQALTVEAVQAFLNHTDLPLSDIGAVMVVSPFGAPLCTKDWDDFTKRTQLPVIIDAAASFDTIKRIPACKLAAHR
jgi:dTDP-4-amino-4,6-dideoxygalactose transaminase